MTIKDIFTKKKTDFEAVIDFFKRESASIRTGRATPALVDEILVEYYGQKMHIKELASLSVPEPRMLAIQPWDKTAVEPISNAIRKSDLGVNPVVDGAMIRITIPMLTEERRKDLIKVLNKKTEESRIKIRQVRESVIAEIQKLEKDGEISEDEKFRGREDLQKIVDEYNKIIGDLEKKKESELLS